MHTLLFRWAQNLVSTIIILIIPSKPPIFYVVPSTDDYPLGEELTPFVALAIQ